MDISTASNVSQMQQNYQSDRVIRNEAQELGREDFMKILIAEMKHQDPLNPMDNKESIAQFAQFSSLSQMESLNTNFESFMSSQKRSNMSTGVQFIGKKVQAISNDETVEGKVTGINQEDGNMFLKLEKQSISEDGEKFMEEILVGLDDITDVNDDQRYGTSNSIVTGAQFIGKRIRTPNVQGEVMSASMKENQLMLNIKTSNDDIKSVAIGEVKEVAKL